MTSVENAVAKAPETVFYDKGTLIDLVQTGGQPMKSFMASPATVSYTHLGHSHSEEKRKDRLLLHESFIHDSNLPYNF